MRGCKGRKLGCVNGCVRLDCILFVSFLCVFFIFKFVFPNFSDAKVVWSCSVFHVWIVSWHWQTRCMLYIFSVSTRQDPCALALLGEFRTKLCMLSNHETILCMYLHIQYTYHISDIHAACYLSYTYMYICTYIRMNQYDWWWSVFPLHMAWTILQPSRSKGRWHRRSAETTRQCYRLLGIWMEWRTVTGVECFRFAFTFYWASRLVASPAWTRASKGYENSFKFVKTL